MSQDKLPESALQPPGGSQPTTPVWYKPTLGPRLTPLMQKMLEKYSGVPGEEIEEHVSEVRDKAWTLYKYPCIGQWQFLYTRTPSLSCWATLLERVRAGASVLDLGCCFAQDLRILAAGGAPTRNLLAADIASELWELGYELFRDREKLEARFLEADIFDEDSGLAKLKGDVDVVLATHFFHLFSWDMQVTAFKRVIEMLRPGGWIVGYNIGTREPKEVPVGKTKGSESRNAKYYHDEESFSRMWEQIEEETGTRTQWNVDVSISSLEEWGMPKEDYEWMGPNARGLTFFISQQS